MQTGIVLLLLGALVLAAALLTLRYFGRHPLSRDFDEPDAEEQAPRPDRPQEQAQDSGISELEKTVIVAEDET